MFVEVGVDHRGRPLLVETCELEPAWLAAHSQPQPAGAVAFHVTRGSEQVLREGLNPALARTPCKHVCLAETAEIAAGLGLPGVVVEVDVSGLDLFFELGEARHHATLIEPSRLGLLDRQPGDDATGWSDPAWRRNHTDCLAVGGLPFSRVLLRKAAEEADCRWGGEYNLDQFKAVVAELLTA